MTEPERTAAGEHRQAACRWLIRADLPEVLQIERLSFRYPWEVADFRHHLSQRDVIGKVATRGDRVVGFVVYRLGKRSTRILNLAVRPAYWREGIGSSLLKSLKERAHLSRRKRIVADVGERNLAAQVFFRSLDFRCQRILPTPWEITEEAAYRFFWECS